MQLRVQDPDLQLADADRVPAPDVRYERFSGPLVDVDLVEQSLRVARYLSINVTSLVLFQDSMQGFSTVLRCLSLRSGISSIRGDFG